jgi:hypothetical protein
MNVGCAGMAAGSVDMSLVTRVVRVMVQQLLFWGSVHEVHSKELINYILQSTFTLTHYLI